MTTPRQNRLQQLSAQAPDPETARRMVASFEEASRVAEQGWNTQLSAQMGSWMQSFGQRMEGMQQQARDMQQEARLLYPVTQQVRDIVAKADRTVAAINEYATKLQTRERETAAVVAERRTMQEIIRERRTAGTRGPTPRLPGLSEREQLTAAQRAEREADRQFAIDLGQKPDAYALLPTTGFRKEEIARIAEAGAAAAEAAQTRQQAGLSFTAYAQQMNQALQQSFQVALTQGRLPMAGGGGIGARPVTGLPQTYPEATRLVGVAERETLYHLGRVNDLIRDLAGQKFVIPTLGAQFRDMGVMFRQFGQWINEPQRGRGGNRMTRILGGPILGAQMGRVGTAFRDLAPTTVALRQTVADLRTSFTDVGQSFGRLFGSGGGGLADRFQGLLHDLSWQFQDIGTSFRNLFTSGSGAFRAPFTEMGKAFNLVRGQAVRMGRGLGSLFGALRAPLREIYDRTLGTPPEIQQARQRLTGAQYITQHGKAPPGIRFQLERAEHMAGELDKLRQVYNALGEEERRQLAFKQEDMTGDQYQLALKQQEAKEIERNIRLTGEQRKASSELDKLFLELNRRTKPVIAAFGQMGRAGMRSFRNIALVGGIALGIITKLGVGFGNLSTQVMMAGATSASTGAELHRMATGFQALTGIRTAAQDLEAFERAQRAVAAGMRFGEPPTRRQVLAYSQLGIALGQQAQLNETLYNRLGQMDLATREWVANVVGIPQSVMKAVAAQYSWADAQRVGVRMTQEQIEEGHRLDVRFQALQNTFKEVAMEVGPEMLKFLISLKQNVLPIAQALGSWVANNSKLVTTMVVLGATMAGIMPLFKMFVTLRTAGMAPWPVALGLLGAAAVIGIGGAILSAKLSKDMNKGIEDAMVRANARTAHEQKDAIKEGTKEANAEIQADRLAAEAKAKGLYSGMTAQDVFYLGASREHMMPHIMTYAQTRTPGQASAAAWDEAEALTILDHNAILAEAAHRQEFDRRIANERTRAQNEAIISWLERRLELWGNMGGVNRWEAGIMDNAPGGRNTINNFYGDTFFSEEVRETYGLVHTSRNEMNQAMRH